MKSFQQLMAQRPVRLDERDHIGPHHLAIGKTRKLFEHDGIIHAFFSRGFAIAHARLDANTFALKDVRELDLPIAWGGGAFCIDNDAEGRVSLVFLHRNQHEFCSVDGKLAKGDIAWDGWRTLLYSVEHQAAPWVEMGPGGIAWASVLDRAGDFRVAMLKPGETPRIGNLFLPGEASWYHSCVQMLPLGEDLCLAVGFRGEFPRSTELVFKTVSSKLEMGPSLTLAPNNVNDKLTFHFQAVGDAKRNVAHIVYLDDGLGVSHALYEKGAWHVTKLILPVASFAPQITIDDDGRAVMLAPDYEGTLWTATWSRKTGWSPARKIAGKAPNVSPLFQQTGYGTGGLIAAARSSNGRVPYVFGVIDDNSPNARATLFADALAAGTALAGLSVSQKDGALAVELSLAALRESDLRNAGRCWQVSIPSEDGRLLKLSFAGSKNGLSTQAAWLERDGSLKPEGAKLEVHAVFADAFSANATGALQAKLATSAKLLPAKAWAEFYREGWTADANQRAQLADVIPFEPETAARMALDPSRIAHTFKRMV